MPLCDVTRLVGSVQIRNIITDQSFEWNAKSRSFVQCSSSSSVHHESKGMDHIACRSQLYGVVSITNTDIDVLIIVESSSPVTMDNNTTNSSNSGTRILTVPIFSSSTTRGGFKEKIVRRVNKFRFEILPSSSSEAPVLEKYLRDQVFAEVERLVSCKYTNYYFVEEEEDEDTRDDHSNKMAMNLTRPAVHFINNDNNNNNSENNKERDDDTMMFCFNREQFTQSENNNKKNPNFMIFCPMIRGFIGGFDIDDSSNNNNSSSSNSRCILIGRQCPGRVGPRYHARGLHNNNSDSSTKNAEVSNFYEVEQIVVNNNNNTATRECSSFLCYRGSIPFVWSQTPTLFDMKPKVVIAPSPTTNNNNSDDQERFNNHFDSLRSRSRVSNSVRVLSLLSTRHHELELTNKYQTFTKNSSSPKNEYSHFNSNHLKWKTLRDHSLQYSSSPLLDHRNKNNNDNIGNGKEDDNNNNNATKDHNSHTNLTRFKITTNGDTSKASSSSSQSSNQQQQQQQQHTVLRINCLDCLDRTSLVQAEIGFEMLKKQLQNNNTIITNNINTINNNTLLEASYRNLFQDTADIIAGAYAGTDALFGTVVRRSNINSSSKDDEKDKNPKGGILMRMNDALIGIKRFANALWFNSLKQDAETIMITARTQSVVVHNNNNNRQHQNEIINSILLQRRLLPFAHLALFTASLVSSLNIVRVSYSLVKCLVVNAMMMVTTAANTNSFHQNNNNDNKLDDYDKSAFLIHVGLSLLVVVGTRMLAKKVSWLRPSPVILF